MNVPQYISSTAASVKNTGNETGSPGFAGRTTGAPERIASVLKDCLNLFRREPQSKSILRNQTNLPMFFAIALGLSLLCNFTLRENTAEASRANSSRATIEQVWDLVRKNPDDAEQHSRLGELYFKERKLKRAMFHFAESSRLIELHGD